MPYISEPKMLEIYAAIALKAVSLYELVTGHIQVRLGWYISDKKEINKFKTLKHL